MRVFLIGCVSFSRACFQTLLQIQSENQELQIVGVATKSSSNFNADFYDLSPLCKEHCIPYIYAKDINA